MLKRLNAITSLLYVLISICSSVASYASETDGSFWYTLNGDEATVTGSRSFMGNTAYIPSQVTFNNLRYNVVEIDDDAFDGWQLLEYCRIPEGVRSIGQSIFSNTKVSSIVVPSTVQTCGGFNYGAFNNSTMRTIIYLPPTPPRFWNAVSNTYVIDPDLYTEPTYKSSNAKIKGIVEFSSHEFEYSGESPTFTLTNNLQADGWNAEYTLPQLEKNAGSYEIIIPIKFQHKQTYERFTANIIYRYVIKKQILTVVINNQEKLYGDENPSFSYEISGFWGYDNENDIQVLPNIVCSATKTSDIGEYQITGNGGQSTNYDFSFRTGTLRINKAPLSVKAIDSVKEFGNENPQFEIQFTGLKNGESSPKWDKFPVFSTDAAKVSNVGVYPVAVVCEPHNYEIISNTAGTLTINPAPITILADNCQREYYEQNPQYTFTIYGLRNNDDATCLSKQPTFNCPAVISSDCGEYSVTPSSAEAQNYSISYKSGILTITKAPLTLMADNATREYGDENPMLKFSFIGLKGSDTQESVLQQLPTLSTSALTNSNVGEYPITITGGASKNYQLSYRQGILTVTKAPLSVSVENAERVYGSNNPSFVRTYLGFKLSDTETSAFSVLPKITCSAAKTSDVGEYQIVVSGGTSRNYEIGAYENGILTVTKAKATISANNKSRFYFEENPQFDFSVTGLLIGDTKSCLTTLPSYNCDANILSNVGNYQIVPSDAVAKNYVFEYAPGNLTINKRQLTASVGNYSRAFGEDNPTFEINYNGFVNNEDASVLIESATISCSATSSSDVGSYPIEIVGGDATNYRISKYNSGTLTITKANQSIIWNQDLSNIELYSQVELTATSDANLPITYEMSPNNVATLYSNAGKWYLDCYGSGAVNIRAIQSGDKNHNAATIVSKTLVVFGGGDDPSNPQIFLNVDEPGALSSMIADNRKYQIKNLRLTGYLNGTDINFIREMAGSDSYGNTTPGVLETLDISGCTIVSGGRSYYQSNRTSENVVGNYMFYNCKVLTTLRIPDNTISIGDYALADCERISVISIPNCVKAYGEQSFRNDISLLRIPMSNELERIGDMAFVGCNGLTEIIIPSAVKSIGAGIVKDCQNITQINVEVGNTNYTSRDGVLFNSDSDELIIFPVNYADSEYSVPDGVNKISSYAFVNAKGLKMVNLPTSLSAIGQDAFIGCVNLNRLRVQALTPPTCQNDCFDNISKTRCELQVPVGCRSYYWVAPVWSEFNKIIETDFSGIEDVYSDDLQVGIINGRISVSGCPDNMTVRIYQINGTLIYQEQANNGEIEFEPASHGMYIVMIGNKAFKLMVK